MSKVTIPSKHYVGLQVRSGSNVPLAYMTPWGEDAAAKKRMASVDQWANGRYNQSTKLASTTIDNSPIIGFKLTSSIRKGDYGAVDKWRIEDPRGFELEITSSNLAELMSITTIEKGEILEKCVWGRNGGSNILLSVESEDYKEALNMTAIVNSTASWKDVKLGNEIILQNGTRGIYLGRYHCLAMSRRDSDKSVSNRIKIGSGPRTYIQTNTVTNFGSIKFNSELISMASPKLSSIVGTNELTAKEAESYVNQLLDKSECYSSDRIYAVSANPFKEGSWSIELDPLEDDVDPWGKRSYYSKDICARQNNKQLVIMSTSDKSTVGIHIHEDMLASGCLSVKTVISNVKHYSYRSSSYNEISEPIDNTSVSDYYRMKVCFNTKLGNNIRVAI